ncbi:MAG: hypothetical protein H0W61_07290 [Bacteroidetes bacterium]|nr:hypothetical protein [Bacteroidota bacterium]
MTNLIVISSETSIKDETAVVNDLFHAGLRLFHLRKPGFSFGDQCHYLNLIEEKFRDKISVHQNYETVNEFGLMYFHVKEKDRQLIAHKDLQSNTDLTPSQEVLLELLETQGKKKSTSFHDYTDLQFESHHWNYCFFGPVFNSISKADYKSTLNKDFHNEGDLYQRVFALGGLTKDTIEIAFRKEFYGAAVLGTIWSEPSKAIEKFKELELICRQNVHTY